MYLDVSSLPRVLHPGPGQVEGTFASPTLSTVAGTRQVLAGIY